MLGKRAMGAKDEQRLRGWRNVHRRRWRARLACWALEYTETLLEYLTLL